MFSAVLLSSTILCFAIRRFPRYNLDQCEILFRLSVFFYSIHRVFFYAFIILRIEVVNKNQDISRLTMCVIWFVFYIGAVFIAFGLCLVTEEAEENKLCKIRVKRIVLLPASIFDIFIFLVSSWLFVRPILKNLKRVESDWMKKTVVKELVSVIISLLSTILALVTVSIFDGIVNIAVGLDSTITTCCLLAIATPVKGSSGSQGCLSKLYTCIFCQRRKRRLSNVLAQLEEPTLHLEHALPVKNLRPKQLKAENQISRAKENSLSIPQYNPEVNSRTQRVSVILELQDIHVDDESTYSGGSLSSRSSKYPRINSLSVETMKKYDECNKVYYDIPGEEVYICFQEK
jgi:hypothetical protein